MPVPGTRYQGAATVSTNVSCSSSNHTKRLHRACSPFSCVPTQIHFMATVISIASMPAMSSTGEPMNHATARPSSTDSSSWPAPSTPTMASASVTTPTAAPCMASRTSTASNSEVIGASRRSVSTAPRAALTLKPGR